MALNRVEQQLLESAADMHVHLVALCAPIGACCVATDLAGLSKELCNRTVDIISVDVCTLPRHT